MLFTRPVLISLIKAQCFDTNGLEQAFAQTTLLFLKDLARCIQNNEVISRSTYDEPLDFLDGNGFIVEGNETDGYTIQLMIGEL